MSPSRKGITSTRAASTAATTLTACGISGGTHSLAVSSKGAHVITESHAAAQAKAAIAGSPLPTPARRGARDARPDGLEAGHVR